MKHAIFAMIAGALLAPAALAQGAPATPPAAPALAAPITSPPPNTHLRAKPHTPRTSYGAPSFEGVWSANYFQSLEAVPGYGLTTDAAGSKAILANTVKQLGAIPGISLDPELIPGLEATDGLALVAGELRTRAVVEPADGRLPLTPEARRANFMAMLSMGGMHNPEERPNWERCVALWGQPPVAMVSVIRQIIQTPTTVILHTEYGDEARIIPFADAHKPAMFHGALGDSIARWDGATLVIETVGLPEKDRNRMFPSFVVTSKSKVIERLTRLSESELLYQFTVEDPSVYTGPWLAEYSLYKTTDKMYEFSCHAGNYSLPNIMRAQRIADDKKAAAVAPAPKP